MWGAPGKLFTPSMSFCPTYQGCMMNLPCSSHLPTPCCGRLHVQEEERERRLDYVPDESALNTNALEVRYHLGGF